MKTTSTILSATCLTASLLFAPPAFAEDCSAKPSQSEMNDCAGRQFQVADKHLNQLYASYRARLDDKLRKAMRESQLAWMKFRDLNCDFASSGVEGGTARPYVQANCLIALTASRVKDFEYFVNCTDGDLSCPSPKPASTDRNLKTLVPPIPSSDKPLEKTPASTSSPDKK